ncbi:MAG: response regulator [Anaerolineae bacterium]|nr:response regulator [Anaerolineae bacterium]
MTQTKNELVLRILLVEDNEDDEIAFRRAMKNATIPVEITRCERAEEALNLLHAHHNNVSPLPFNLLVTDYKLPGMSGLDLCLALLQRHAPISLALLTGVGSEHLAVRALKAGVDDYLIKDSANGYLTLLPVVLPVVVQRYEDRIARQQAENKVWQHNRELTLLSQVGRELATMLDPQAVIRRLLDAVTSTLDAEGASLWLWAEATSPDEPRSLVCQGFFNIIRGGWFPMEVRLAPEQGIAGWVATHGQSVVLPLAQNDPRFFPGVDQITGLQTTSLLAAPLRKHNTVIGVLEIVNKRDGGFAKDLTLVETLATSAAIALDNARLVETLRQRTDELESRNTELQTALNAIKSLSGLVPICAWCGSKIQDDDGQWVTVETYIENHSQAEFTHGICPDCLREWKGHPPEGQDG